MLRRSSMRKRMSGRMRSTPGKCSSAANDTPQSTISQVPPPPVADAVDREIHADLADAAERREQKLEPAINRPAPARRRERAWPRRAEIHRRPLSLVAPVGKPQQQPATLINPLDRGRQSRCREAARACGAHAGGTREPVGADAIKPGAAMPLARAAAPSRRTALQTGFRPKYRRPRPRGRSRDSSSAPDGAGS